MRFQEGRAWIERCPRCEYPVIEAHTGYKVRLSTRAMPYSHAVIVGRYHLVYNVFIGTLQLYVSAWFPVEGRPLEGRLYSQHICRFWR